MRQRRFGDLAREMCLVACPISEGASEPVNCRAIYAEPAHDFRHGDVAQHPPTRTLKNEFSAPRLGQLLEDRHGTVGQRDAVLAGGFHSGGRDGPDLFLYVDFRPSRPIDFAGARCGEDGELQSHRRDRPGLVLAETRDERRNVRVGHRGVVAARELLALRKKVGQVAAPCRRVFARAMALGLGGVENRFDSAPETRGGFRLFGPKRLEHLENGRSIDFIDRPGPQRRGLFGERCDPLAAMLLVSPLRALGLDQRVGDLPERRLPGLAALFFPDGDGIEALAHQSLGASSRAARASASPTAG